MKVLQVCVGSFRSQFPHCLFTRAMISPPGAVASATDDDKHDSGATTSCSSRKVYGSSRDYGSAQNYRNLQSLVSTSPATLTPADERNSKRAVFMQVSEPRRAALTRRGCCSRSFRSSLAASRPSARDSSSICRSAWTSSCEDATRAALNALRICRRVPELVEITPALQGLKGNVEMILASRLSTLVTSSIFSMI